MTEKAKFYFLSASEVLYMYCSSKLFSSFSFQLTWNKDLVWKTCRHAFIYSLHVSLIIRFILFRKSQYFHAPVTAITVLGSMHLRNSLKTSEVSSTLTLSSKLSLKLCWNIALKTGDALNKIRRLTYRHWPSAHSIWISSSNTPLCSYVSSVVDIILRAFHCKMGCKKSTCFNTGLFV